MDAEGQPHAAALGDDGDGVDDEDGWGDNTIPVGESYYRTITSHGRGYLNIWIDFDHNGG
jgi:hypothetical protein